MTSQTLIDAVKARIQENWKGEQVYTNYLPKDFKRPSFALELQKDEWTDANIVLVKRTVTLLLTGFVEKDAYGDSAREILNQRMEVACGLFALGFLLVDDRAVSVRAVRGTGAPDFFEVTLIFTWMDQRPGYHDPDDMTDPVSSAVPKMEHIECSRTFSAQSPNERAI